MRDPQQFIQSLDTLDPVIIDKMTTMVKKLIADGELERQGHHDREDRAKARMDNAVASHKSTGQARDIAAGLVKNQEGVVDDASTKEQAAKDTLADRTRELNAAIADEALKAKTRVSEVKRIDAEKILLQKIVAKLEQLLPGVSLVEGRLAVTDYIIGRNLLSTSTSNADRDAVQKVVDKVNSMVGRGEQQRAAVIKADKDAKAALVVAKAIHADAVAAYNAAAEVLAAAEAKLEVLKQDLTLKEELFADATAELNAATEHLAEMTKIRKSEDIRLDNEKDTCQQILKILAEMKAKDAANKKQGF